MIWIGAKGTFSLRRLLGTLFEGLSCLTVYSEYRMVPLVLVQNSPYNPESSALSAQTGLVDEHCSKR
eukprot:13445676-Heterocapsa_arctica.AAC.1